MRENAEVWQQFLDRHLLAVSVELLSILKPALHKGRVCRLGLVFTFLLQALAVTLGVLAAEVKCLYFCSVGLMCINVYYCIEKYFKMLPLGL